MSRIYDKMAHLVSFWFCNVISDEMYFISPYILFGHHVQVRMYTYACKIVSRSISELWQSSDIRPSITGMHPNWYADQDITVLSRDSTHMWVRAHPLFYNPHIKIRAHPPFFTFAN